MRDADQGGVPGRYCPGWDGCGGSCGPSGMAHTRMLAGGRTSRKPGPPYGRAFSEKAGQRRGTLGPGSGTRGFKPRSPPPHGQACTGWSSMYRVTRPLWYRVAVVHAASQPRNAASQPRLSYPCPESRGPAGDAIHSQFVVQPRELLASKTRLKPHVPGRRTPQAYFFFAAAASLRAFMRGRSRSSS